MIQFVHPEAWLLLPIAVLLLRRRLFAATRFVIVLRLLLLGALAGMLAEPQLSGGQPGRDLVLVVDRSHSMPAEGLRLAQEIAEQAVTQRRAGDRIGLVVFGRDAAVEASLAEDYRYQPPARTVDSDGTDLAQGLQKALSLIPPGRFATVLLLSDGEGTGVDPASVAREALRLGVRIDARAVRRAGGLDLAIEEVLAPGETAAGEPFVFAAFVRADVAGEVPVRLLRDGVVIAEGKRRLHVGLNRLSFRDQLREAGVHRYEVEVDAPGDRVPENNRARAVVRVTGPFRVLCVTPAGRSDRFTRALASVGIDAVVTAPSSAPLSLDRLEGFGAVVLEDVAAADLPAGAMAAIERWVRHLGGGVLMTGGGEAYGPGGYYRSPIESVLPVTMEIREEQRKHALAMAIVLDRSGSMRAPTTDGRTKMELANLGACAAVELLGRADAVGVIAVDSAPHTVVEMTPVVDRQPILARVRTIESMGGGIYVGEALEAAARALAGARQSTKHIVLFADAADAEEPGDYRDFVPKLVRAGVTVSVIGLGADTDSDAELLREIARLGNGRCFFTADAVDLPRVFAQETIQVARSSLVEEPTGVDVQPDILALGPLAAQAFPDVGGYSIAYLKARAQVGLHTRDEQRAPLFSFWQSGLGRSAAFLGEVDGPLTGALADWAGYRDFFATVVRWLAGAAASDRVFADLERKGHDGVLGIEVDAGQEALLGALVARVLLPDGRVDEVPLARVDGRRLEGRFPLAGEGVYRAVVEVAGGVEIARVPPITLPYSPEFERRADPEAGVRELARLTEIAEGRLDPPLGDLFAGPRESVGSRPLAPLLALLALALLVMEIAVRRLALRLPALRWPALRLPRWRRTRRPPQPSPGATGSPGGSTPRTVKPPTAPVVPPGTRPAGGLGKLLERSKQRSDERTGR